MRLKNEGIRRTTEVGQYHLSELWFDNRHGVQTCGYISLSSLGIAQDACNDYSPAEVDSLSRVLKNIGIEEQRVGSHTKVHLSDIDPLRLCGVFLRS